MNAYITGSIDASLVVLEGKPNEGTSMEEAEEALWAELEVLKNELAFSAELEKVKNKTESLMIFGQMSILDKAMELAYFELLGDADLLNQEQDKYLQVTDHDIQRVSQQIFRKENSNTLIYLAATHDHQ